MVTCTEEGDSSCSVESDDDSDSAMEGQWLGLSIGLFFLLIFLAWLCRTLSSPQRRLQLIGKFHHCCKEKSPENGDMGYPSADHNGNSTPRRNLSSRSLDRGSPTTKVPSDPVIYYKPSRPTPFRENMPRAGVSVPTELDHFGHYHTEHEDVDGGKGHPENGGYSIPGRPRSRHVRGMKKSRSTVSMTSCNLEPIQEVDDGADSDAMQRVRERLVDAGRGGHQQQLLTSSPLGSRSHPDRLASLAVYCNSDDEDKKGENEDSRNSDSVFKMDPRGVGDKLEEITLDSLNGNGEGDVNFVHGSDDEESVG